MKKTSTFNGTEEAEVTTPQKDDQMLKASPEKEEEMKEDDLIRQPSSPTPEKLKVSPQAKSEICKGPETPVVNAVESTVD